VIKQAKQTTKLPGCYHTNTLDSPAVFVAFPSLSKIRPTFDGRDGFRLIIHCADIAT
jgi:hypothetical protein